MRERKTTEEDKERNAVRSHPAERQILSKPLVL